MINVAQQLPEFIGTDYPGFVEFLKAYYQWYEEEFSPNYFGDLIDVDQTIEPFLKYFRKELDIFGITNDSTSRFYLRHLKELYTSKGSREAFEFLFKILFDKQSHIKMPWDYTFIVSGGKWRVPFSVIVNMSEEDAAKIIGKEVTFYDALGNPYKTVVEYVNLLPSGLVEVFIGRLRTTSLVSMIWDDGGVETTTTTLSQVTSVSVVDGGTGFTVGETFEVNAAGGTGMVVKIASVDAFGGIKAVTIVSFGTGYENDFNWIIVGGEGAAEVTFFPKIHVLVATDTLYLRAAADGTLILGDYTIVTADAANLPHGLATGDPVVYRNGGGDSVGGLDNEEVYYVIRVDATKLKLAATYSDALADIPIDLTPGATGSDHTLSRLGDAILHFSTGTRREYPGYYDGSGSVLGDGCFIEDSFYYQVYSYVTVLEETLAKYETILRSVLHPSGTKHFAEYTVSHDAEFEFGLTLEIDPDEIMPG